MGTHQIESKIANAIDDEKRTGRLEKTLRTTARQNGVHPSDEQLNEVMSFILEYIQHVPFYINEAVRLSRNTNAEREIAQMIRELEAYWNESQDVIPDHLGLLGIMDDAYASMSLLQSISDYCKRTNGVALLAQDWSHANKSIRNLIGEPAASIIDQKVGITVTQNLMGQVMNQILSSGFNFRMSNTPDPIWGNASIDQIVDTRLGAMGVV